LIKRRSNNELDDEEGFRNDDDKFSDKFEDEDLANMRILILVCLTVDEITIEALMNRVS